MSLIVKDKPKIINDIVEFMQKNNLKDINGSIRKGEWKEICIIINKKSDFNEQSRLHKAWNKKNSEIKKKVLEKLNTNSNINNRNEIIKYSNNEWEDFVRNKTNATKKQFLVEVDSIFSHRYF